MSVLRILLILLLTILAIGCFAKTDPDCHPADASCNLMATILLYTPPGTSSALSCNATGPAEPYWSMFGNASLGDTAIAACGFDDGNFMIIGNMGNTPSGITVKTPHYNPTVSFDIFLARVNSAGTPEWITFLGDTNANTAKSIARIGEDRFAISGTGQPISSMEGLTPVNAGGAANDIYVIAVDSGGNLHWFTNLGSGTGDNAGDLAYDELDNSLYVTGLISSPITSINGQPPIDAGQGSNECGVFRLNPADGQVQWYTHVSGSAADTCTSVAIGDHGGPIVAGESQSTTLNGQTPINSNAGGGNPDAMLASLGSDGRLLWSTFIGSTDSDETGRVTALANGNLLLTFHAYDAIASLSGLSPIIGHAGAAGNADGAMVGFSQNGAPLFYTFFGNNGDDDFSQGIIPTPDGGFAIPGNLGNFLTTYGGNPPLIAQTNATESVLFRYDPNGNSLWYSFFGFASGPNGIPQSDNGFLLTGNVTSATPATIDGASPRNAFTGSTQDVGYIRMTANGRLQ